MGHVVHVVFENEWCHSSIIEQFAYFKMAAKMASRIEKMPGLGQIHTVYSICLGLICIFGPCLDYNSMMPQCHQWAICINHEARILDARGEKRIKYFNCRARETITYCSDILQKKK